MAGRTNGDVSLVLGRLLDSYGLDEDTRQRRMDRQKIMQLLWSWDIESIKGIGSELLSGSAYETTTIHGLSSDIDRMLIPNDIRVIDNIQEWKPDAGVDTYMMDNTGCYPAFVKLYLLSCDYPGPLYSDMVSGIKPGHFVNEDGKLFLYNDFFSKMLQNNFRCKTELHGPAVTVDLGVEADNVPTLRSASLPREAAQWKQRQSNQIRAWLDDGIVNQTTYCYLVGVGNKGSPTENIEWRLSFSHIENQLVHAWNNVQYKCYVMMKFIHKDLIKPNVPDCILCSYHYKTTLMWMIEEYPAEYFNELNFTKCILAVLTNLAICVTRKSLPHYFVQGCNLFFNKLEAESSKETAAVLDRIISMWPYCLCAIECRGFGMALQGILQEHIPVEFSCKVILQDQREHMYPFEMHDQTLRVLCHYRYIKTYILSKHYRDVFKLLFNLLQRSKRTNFYFTTENKQFVTFMVKDIMCSVGLKLLRHSNKMTNKAALHYKRSGLGLIQRYNNDRYFDTQLQIAEYFSRVGKYDRALLLLDNIESQIKVYTAYYCKHAGCVKAFPNSHIRAVFDNKPSVKKYCNYYHAAPVTYTQDNLTHVPRPLVYEMFRTTAVSPLVLDTFENDWYNHAVIHCPVYLYYLRFLCFQAIGRYAHRQVALDNMIWASKQLETSTGSHTETNHNILGDCYKTLGQLHTAYREYRKSLLKQKYQNAAIWHLALLVRKKVLKD